MLQQPHGLPSPPYASSLFRPCPSRYLSPTATSQRSLVLQPPEAQILYKEGVPLEDAKKLVEYKIENDEALGVSFALPGEQRTLLKASYALIIHACQKGARFLADAAASQRGERKRANVLRKAV